VTEDPDRVRIGTAEREEVMTRADLPAKPGPASVSSNERPRDWRAIVMALIPLVALGFIILVPHGWLAGLALQILGILLYR
jgi:hypothetical protein